MPEIDSIVGGLRALLFSAALFSAAIFVQELGSGITLLCALWNRRLRPQNLVGLAAFGWFMMACSSMLMTGPRLFYAISHRHLPHFSASGIEAWLYIASMCGMAAGFYIPLLSMMWYRDRLLVGIFAGFSCCVVGMVFALLP